MASMGMPPMGPDPMMGGMPPAPMPPSEDEMIMSLLDAVMQKWTGGEAQLAGEKDQLLQTLVGIFMGPQAPVDPMAMGGPPPMDMGGMAPPPEMGGAPPMGGGLY